MVWWILSILAIVHMLGLAVPTYVKCCGSREGEDASRLAQIVQMNAILNEGRLAKSWDEVPELLTSYSFRTAEPLERYAILETPLPVARIRGRLTGPAEILILQRRDVYDAMPSGRIVDLGRYVIYRYTGDAAEKGDLGVAWMRAGEVHEAFAQAGRDLPVPDDEPARPDVIKAFFWLYFGWAWRVGLAVWVVIDVVLRVRRWLTESSPPPEGVALACDFQRKSSIRQYPW